MLFDPKSVMMNGLRIPLDLTMKQLIYFLFVQQIHYERILKLDGDMRIFDDIDQNNVASIASVLIISLLRLFWRYKYLLTLDAKSLIRTEIGENVTSLKIELFELKLIY